MDEMKNKKPKEFWNMFRTKKTSDESESIDLKDFYNHFKQLTSELKIDEDAECMDFLNDFDSQNCADSAFNELNEAFTLEEIRHAIKLLGRNKACSFDDVIYEYFKEGIDILVKPLVNFIKA